MRRSYRFLFVALTLAVCGLAVRPAAAQGAEHRGVQFLLALDAGDLDAALAMLVDEPELADPEGGIHAGHDAIRAYLEAFSRPILIVESRPSPPGSRRFQALITADGTPLLATFTGDGGRIVRIVLEPVSAEPEPDATE